MKKMWINNTGWAAFHQLLKRITTTRELRLILTFAGSVLQNNAEDFVIVAFFRSNPALIRPLYTGVKIHFDISAGMGSIQDVHRSLVFYGGSVGRRHSGRNEGKSKRGAGRPLLSSKSRLPGRFTVGIKVISLPLCSALTCSFQSAAPP